MTEEKEKNVETEKVFMNPFTDIGFKNIFGRSKNVTMEFLNDILQDREKIVDLVFSDKEMISENRDGRTIIYDIYCTTSDGRHIIIEMQNGAHKYFKERLLYYTSRAISKQGQPGEWDYKLDAVYGIAFVNFFLEKNRSQFLRDIRMVEKSSKEVFYDKYRMIFIELPSFTKALDECKTKLDYWIYMLKNMETSTRLAIEKTHIQTIKEVEESMRLASLNKEDREAYDIALKRYRDFFAHEKYNEEMIQESYKQGEKKGEEKGEAKKNLENAKNFKALGVSVDIISKATGLSPETIASL